MNDLDLGGLVCSPNLAIQVLVELVQAQREEIARLRHDLNDALALAKTAVVEAYYLPTESKQ